MSMQLTYDVGWSVTAVKTSSYIIVLFREQDIE